ncbi:unnamed protein product [Prorocentrum cordatum]|uniref:Integrase catalytic domain-containing protein n=1 Tax=Prorocentrum cordatum TaxID=2364126 RepID=A0ABN9UC47_9DINO|nr:unnamed protein product [Polarella glacialis]
MPLSVMGWIHAWDILDVNTNKKYNTAALMRWKQILKLVFMAIAMTRHPAVALIFHNGRRHGKEEILEGRLEPPAPRRLLPLSTMVKVELQEEMEANGLEFKGLACREMRVILNEQRIENGQSRKGARAGDPELRGLAKKTRAELIQLARKRDVKVTDDMLKDKIVCLLLGQTPTAGCFDDRECFLSLLELRKGTARQVSGATCLRRLRERGAANREKELVDQRPGGNCSRKCRRGGEPELGDDCSEGQKSQTARARRKMKPGQIKRYKDMVNKAISFLTWQTMFLSAFLVKPFFLEGKAIVQDLCEVFNVETDASYDLMQIFAGEASISEEFSRKGLKVCAPIDQKYNYDLRNEQRRREVLQLFYSCKPKLLTLEYPCTLWTQLTRVNYRGEARQQELRRKRRRDRPLLDFVEEIGMMQLNSKWGILFENPWTSEVFNQPQIKRLKEHSRAKEVKIDMCQFNLRHPKSNEMIKKPTKLLVANDSYVKKLGRQCDGSRPHHLLEGAHYTRKAGRYTQEFAKAVLQAYQRSNMTYIMEHGVYATGDLMDLVGGESDEWFYYENVGDFTEIPAKLPDGPDWSRVGRRRVTDLEADMVLQVFEKADITADLIKPKLDRTAKLKIRLWYKPEPVADDIGAKAIQFGPGSSECSSKDLAALRQLHQNLGHPSNEDLARSLRFSGCRSEVVKAAKSLRCATCMSNVRKRIARPARLSHAADCNEQIGLDCFTIKDVDGKPWDFLSVVDLGATFHVVGMIESHHSEVLVKVFTQIWTSWAGPPASAVVDLERGFGSVFQDMLDKFHCVVVPVAGQAAWQRGRTERQGGWWEELAERTIAHAAASGESDMRVIASVVTGAKNALRRQCGFSPEQWMELTTTQHTKELIFSLWNAFMEMQNDNTLRKALLGRTRVRPHPLEQGDLCFYYRQLKKGSIKKGTWLGPAVIVGKQGQNYWISHGGFTELLPRRKLGGQALTINTAKHSTNFEDYIKTPTPPRIWNTKTYEENNHHLSKRKEAKWNLKMQNRLQNQLKTFKEISSAFESTDNVQKQLDKQDTVTSSTFAVILRGARAQSERLRKKLQDKEIAWKDIPEEHKPLYQKAIAEHWEEWKKFGSVEALSLEESQRARWENDSNRFLPSRSVFRDKNVTVRTEANPVPVKAKARLCAGGHRDPDLQTGALRTDAPTVTRTSSLLFFIMAARYDWEPVCADIMSAFMQGEEQPRDKPLFMEQPPQGLPGLQPGQVLRIVKGISSVFAEKWEPLEPSKDRKRDLGCPATDIETAENRSLIGSLGWLATQTLPDLAAGVSMAQRVQNSPAVADLIETNRIASEAKRYKDTAITIPKLNGELCILVFHDAAWANVDEPDDKVTGSAWWCMRRARTAYASEAPKRLKAKSQAGFLVFVAEKAIIQNGEGKAALVDWSTLQAAAEFIERLSCRDGGEAMGQHFGEFETAQRDAANLVGVPRKATSEDVRIRLVHMGDPELAKRVDCWRAGRRAVAHPPGQVGKRVLEALRRPVRDGAGTAGSSSTDGAEEGFMETRRGPDIEWASPTTDQAYERLEFPLLKSVPDLVHGVRGDQVAGDRETFVHLAAVDEKIGELFEPKAMHLESHGNGDTACGKTEL